MSLVAETGPIVKDSEDEENLVRLLRRLATTVPMPTRVFNAWVPLTVSTAIETVVLRRRRSNVEVLLARRSDKDPYYKSMMHSPGSLVRASDIKGEDDVPTNYDPVFARLEQHEIGLKFVKAPVFVRQLPFATCRGPHICLVHTAEIEGESKTGTFVPVDNLPSDLVKSHNYIIPAAVEAFDK